MLLTNNIIVRDINAAITRNAWNGGPVVTAVDKNGVQHRIVDARVNAGVVQGKSLSLGRWFTIAACSVFSGNLTD